MFLTLTLHFLIGCGYVGYARVCIHNIVRAADPGSRFTQSGSERQEKPLVNTVCPKSIEPFYIVTYYIIWVKTSWTYSS